MLKRVVLFVITNLAIVAMLTIVLRLLGISGYAGRAGRLDFASLAVFCFVWGMGGAFLSLQLSRWGAKRMMGVQLVDGQTGNQDVDWLYNAIGHLTRQSNLPMPEVGVYDSPEVNAFATGPSKRRSLVAVSTGLLRNMTRDEVQGVLAHEVSHIGNGDMVTMTLLQGVVNAFVMFLARVVAHVVRLSLDSRNADAIAFVVMLVLQFALGILGLLVVAAFSRHREFRADAGGASLAGRAAMVGALKRLVATQERVDVSRPALASFKIAGGRGLFQLWATHPPLERRIAALEKVA
jgi:heat shock protein HtpX